MNPELFGYVDNETPRPRMADRLRELGWNIIKNPFQGFINAPISDILPVALPIDNIDTKILPVAPITQKEIKYYMTPEGIDDLIRELQSQTNK